MNKAFLVSALVLGLTVPAYAQQFDNKGDSRYASPEVVADKQDKGTVERTDKEKGEQLPINLTGDHAEYDSVSGDFHVSGNVVVTQGSEKLLTTYAYGNMKTGDIWLEQGGTLIEPDSKMHGKWVHYNFNTKPGEIKEISGKGGKDWFEAPHATIYPDKMVVDQGGTSTRCPAVKHPPCLSIKAKTFEIYPKEKMVAKDVQVFVKGKHVYSRDRWENSLNDEGEERIMPRIGYDGSDNGFYAKIEYEKPLSDKTTISADIAEYSKAGFKPVYRIHHNERNFTVGLSTGWDEDDGDWYEKQMNWELRYKSHRIADGLPLSYSAYLEHGLWQRLWDSGKRGPSSWHTEYGAYLNHDPIYLFNTKNTSLNLTIGKKWVHESSSGDLRSTNMYYATLNQKLMKNMNTWIGYYQEDETSSLFEIGQPDMAKEVRNGIQYRPDDKNTFTIVNRYDAGKGRQYETDYRWLHRFCCWAIEFEYQKEIAEKDSTFRIKYYFLNW